MALTNEDLKFTISVDSKGAVKGITDTTGALIDLGEVSGSVEASLKKTSNSFSALGATVIVVNQAFELAKKAYSAISAPLEAATKEFMNQEQANYRLANALALTGSNTKAAYAEMQAFADEMQSTTMYSGEATKSLISLAKAAGVTNDQAKLMTRAAMDLATVTGKDVNMAMSDLLGQLQGSPGKMAKYVQGLSYLTEEELKAGKGIELVSKQFEGSAKIMGQSLPGKVAIAKNAFSDFMGMLGRAFSEMVNLPSLLDRQAAFWNKLTNTLKNALPYIAAVRDRIGELAGVFVQWVQSINFDTVLANLEHLAKVLGIVAIAIAAVKFGPLVVSLAPMLATFGILALKVALVTAGIVALAGLADVLVSNWDNLGNVLAGHIMLAFTGIRAAITQVITWIVTAINEVIIKGLEIANYFVPSDKIQDQIAQIRGASSELETTLSGLKDEFKAVGDATVEATDKFQDEFSMKGLKSIQDAFSKTKDLFGDLKKTIEKPLEIKAPKTGGVPAVGQGKPTTPREEPVKFPKLFEADQLKQIGAVFGQGAASIAGAASDFVNPAMMFMTASNVILDAVQKLINFIPEILNKIANIFSSLTDLPIKIVEGVQNVFGQFGRLIREFIPNIIKMIPGLVGSILDGIIGIIDSFSSLFETLPDLIIDQLLNKMTDIVERFITGLFKAIPRLVFAWVRLTGALFTKIIPAIFKSAFYEFPKMIINALREGIASLWTGFEENMPVMDTKPIEEAAKKATEVAEQVFAVLDDTLTVQVQDRLKKQMDAWTNRTTGLLKALWDALVRAWEWIRDKILMPVFMFFKGMWESFCNLLKAAWEGLLHIWEVIKSTIIDPFVSFLQTARNALLAVWNAIKSTIIDPFVNALQSVFGWVYNSVVAPLQNFFSGLANWKFPNIPGVDQLWSAINKLFDKPGWLETFDNLISKLTNWDWPSLPDMGGGGGGGPASWFASGGLVPVYAQTGEFMRPRGTDTVPAMVTPGEFVMSRGAVDALGLPAMNLINQGKLPVTTGKAPAPVSQNVSFDISITTQNVDRKFIESQMVPIVADKLKRMSVDGQFWIDKRGVRE